MTSEIFNNQKQVEINSGIQRGFSRSLYTSQLSHDESIYEKPYISRTNTSYYSTDRHLSVQTTPKQKKKNTIKKSNIDINE